MILAIDFDGTLVDHEYPKIGALKPGAKEALLAFKKAGHKIVIWTCRAGEEERAVRQFMNDNGVPYDVLNAAAPGADLGTRKIYADVYIDDKCMRFDDNWEDLRRLIVGK